MKELYPHLNPLRYRKKVEVALEEFRDLKNGQWYPMEKIQNWFLFNEQFHAELYQFYYKQLWWNEMEDGSLVRLPELLGTSEEIFCELYSKLDLLLSYYNYESEAGNQVKLYEKARIKDDTLRPWVERNKSFYLDMQDHYFHYNSIVPTKGITLNIQSEEIQVHPKYFPNCFDLALILEHYNELQYFDWTCDTSKNYLTR